MSLSAFTNINILASLWRFGLSYFIAFLRAARTAASPGSGFGCPSIHVAHALLAATCAASAASSAAMRAVRKAVLSSVRADARGAIVRCDPFLYLLAPLISLVS